MDCQWFKNNHCRSCELLGNSYEETLLLKEQKLQSLFNGINLNLKPTVGLISSSTGSRNKVKLAVSGDFSNFQFGFYDSALKFSALESCPVHMEGLNDLLPLLKEKLIEYKVIPYSVQEKKGELKYLIISKSQSHNEFLVRFVLRSKESLDRLRKLSSELTSNHPLIKVVTANIQPEHKAVLEGEDEIILSEAQYILHQFGDIHLTLGPRSFFQVTPEIAGKLYESVGRSVLALKVTSFLDLFCGVGAFSYFAAKSCSDVTGVEISKEAIVCAESSRKLNSVSGKLNFAALDVGEFLKTQDESFDAVLVNPPRRGLNPEIISDIIVMKPRILFYSSCNAETLARDYSSFKDDYEIAETQVFDMFPFTEHFETLMILKRRVS